MMKKTKEKCEFCEDYKCLYVAAKKLADYEKTGADEGFLYWDPLFDELYNAVKQLNKKCST